MTAHWTQLDLPLPIPCPQTAEYPSAGVIAGGPFDGCSYVLIELRQVGDRCLPYVRATAPAWPFPREVLVRPPARLLAARVPDREGS